MLDFCLDGGEVGAVRVQLTASVGSGFSDVGVGVGCHGGIVVEIRKGGYDDFVISPGFDAIAQIDESRKNIDVILSVCAGISHDFCVQVEVCLS